LRPPEKTPPTTKGIMEIRPLSNKTWASIFIAMVFLAVLYLFNIGMINIQQGSNPTPMETVQTE
jgi:hypothetical protein